MFTATAARESKYNKLINHRQVQLRICEPKRMRAKTEGRVSKLEISTTKTAGEKQQQSPRGAEQITEQLSKQNIT